MVVKMVLGTDVGTFKGVEPCNIKYFGDSFCVIKPQIEF